MLSCLLCLASSLAPGCGAESPPLDPLEVDVQVSQALPTLVTLDWVPPSPGLSWVEYGVDGEAPLVTPVQDQASPHFLLLGLPPLATVTWHAFTEGDDGVHEAEGQVQTGNLPAEIPGLDVTVSVPESISSERFVVGSLVGATGWIFIADRQGRIVWWHQMWSNDSRMLWMVRFHPGGGSLHALLTSLEGVEGLFGVQEVSMEGEEVGWVEVPLAHHAFDFSPDGQVAALVYDVRPWTDPGTGETVQVAGDAIVQEGEDGLETVFTTWDAWEPARHGGWGTAPSFLDGAGDWTHSNSLDWNGDLGTWMVSMAYQNSVLDVDPTTGTFLRILGSLGSKTCLDSTPFQFQHSPSITGTGTLLVTSEWNGRGMVALEYAIGSCLEEVWSYGKSDPIPSVASPAVLRLMNGNTLFNGSTTGTLTEVTPDGQVVWELVSDVGAGFSQVLAVHDLYTGE